MVWWRRREPTVKEVWTDVFKDMSKFRTMMNDPETKKAMRSFGEGAQGLWDDVRGIRDDFQKMFGRETKRRK